MQRYVEQLIEDIRAIAKNPPNVSAGKNYLSSSETETEYFDDVEKFIRGDELNLSAIVGLPKSALPDHQRLSDRQVKWLCQELILMLRAWNFEPEFPCKLPVRLQYQTIRDHWDDKVVYVASGTMHIEFCSYDRDECPFPDHCTFCDEMLEMEEHAALDESMITDLFEPLADNISLMNSFDFNNHPKKHTSAQREKKIIPGIYNYCNRWCERCAFTDQCSVFASEKEMREIANASEDQRQRMIDEMEKRIFGFDDFDQEDFDEGEATDDFPDFDMDFEDEEEYENEQNDLFSPRKQAERHPLVLKVRDYSDLVREWLMRQEANTKKDFHKLLAEGSADIIFEALEVIGWYHLFLFTKTERAMNGHYEMAENEFAEEDMNGSAKVALLGMDECIEAFTTLHLHLRSEKTAIVSFRKMLEEIRFEAEIIFPNARNFIRPGLDEMD